MSNLWNQLGQMSFPIELSTPLGLAAWSALAGVPVAQVRAAFYYVAHDQTVRPADLLDEAGLAALIEHVPAEE